MRAIASVLIYYVFTLPIWGQQYYMSLDKDTVSIGEPINLTIAIADPQNIKNQTITLDLNNIENLVYEQDTILLEPTADIEILDSGGLSNYLKDNRIEIPLNELDLSVQPWEKSLKLSFYSIGVFYIPNLHLGTEKDTLKNQIGNFVFVNPPEDFLHDSTKMINDIKPIIEVQTSMMDYVHYLYWLIGLLAFLIIGLYIYRKIKALRKKEAIEITQPEEEPIVIIKESPHIIALRKLRMLKENEIWKEGNVKKYQSDLTFIIREYLEGRYQISALELTSSEILNNLKDEGFDQELKTSLQEILTVADLVKFAKANPEEDIHEMFLNRAITFVEQTKDVADVE